MHGSKKSSSITENEQLTLPDVETRNWRETKRSGWIQIHKLSPEGRMLLVLRKQPLKQK